MSHNRELTDSDEHTAVDDERTPPPTWRDEMYRICEISFRRNKPALQQDCERPDGPIGKLRTEMGERMDAIEADVKVLSDERNVRIGEKNQTARTIVLVGLLITAVTGGIQLWAKTRERPAVDGDALKTIKIELQGELRDALKTAMRESRQP